jgi:anti-sigma factor RsiW
MSNEMLDILMGKYLDGEITPQEQRLLDQSLANDEAARLEFEGFRRLRQQTRSVIGETLAGGQPMEAIFEAAWKQTSPARRRQNRLFRREWIPIFAGLAAGLVIGIVFHAMLIAPKGAIQPNSQSMAQNTVHPGPIPPAGTAPGQIVPVENRNVDWYTVTEPSGDQWLLEGYRRQQVSPAMYYGDL